MEITEEKEIELKPGSNHNKSPLRSGADAETGESSYTSEAANRGKDDSAQDVIFCTSWVLLITSFLMEIVCSVLIQLKYPLESMVLAYVALLLTILELILIAGLRLMKLGRRINYCGSIANSFGNNGDLILVYGFRIAAALWQGLYTTLQYKYPNNNQIRMDPLPFIFLLFVLISRSMNTFKAQPHEPQSSINGHGIKLGSADDGRGSNMEQNGKSLEINEAKVDAAPSNPSEAAANENLSEVDSNSSRADEAEPQSNTNLSENECMQEMRIDKGKETITESDVKSPVCSGNVPHQVHREMGGSSLTREATNRGRRVSFRELRFCRNWFFLIISLVLEGVCATLDQLNYPLVSMVVAYLALFLTILELMIGGSTLLRSKWNELSTIVRWYGLASALWQCIYSTFQYKCSDNNPIRMNLQLSIFLLFVVIHRWNLSFVHHRYGSTMERNGISLEMNEPEVDDAPSNPSSRADEAEPPSNANLSENVCTSTNELGSADHGYGWSKMDQNCQSLEMDNPIEKAADEAVSAMEFGAGIEE